MKARFGILRHPVDVNLEDAPHVIYAFSVLHIFCEMCCDSINDEEVRCAVEYDKHFQPLTILR